MPLFDTLRLIEETLAGDGAWNMARDEVLFFSLTTPWLRVYTWREPTVSLGYFTSLQRARMIAGDRPLVRRWTGGGIVEHGTDFTWSVGIPAGPADARKASDWYELLHAALARAYAALNCETELWPCLKACAAPGAASNPVTQTANRDVCFQAPVTHDLRGPDGTKWAGGAQRRTREGLLYQGSSVLPPGIRSETLTAALAGELGSVWETPPAPDHAAADELRAKYADKAWTERVS